MELTEQRVNDIFVVQVKGKLDSNTSPEFEKFLMSSINSGEKKILIDCKDLDYVSSAGLRALLLGAKVLSGSGGKITLSSMKEHVYQVFDIAGFTSMFEIYTSSEEGLRQG